jgi:hypothetical protein
MLLRVYFKGISYIMVESTGMARTGKMESKNKERACWTFLSHFVCVCGKLSTYPTNHPKG